MAFDTYQYMLSCTHTPKIESMSLEKPASAPSPSAEEYKEIETTIAAKRAELSTSSVDRMGELVAEIQELETKKADAFDSSHEEASAENSRMDAEQAAFETAHDEAHVENERLDAEKSAQNERVVAIDAEITNERGKLNGATAEDLGAIVQRIKELEAQKTQSPEVTGETTTEEMSDEEKLAEEKELISLGQDISQEKYELANDQEKLARLNSRLKKMERARVDLKDRLSSLVRESAISSTYGGTEWELVNESNELRSLIREGVKDHGPESPESTKRREKRRALEEEGVTTIWDMGGIDQAAVLLKGIHGDIGSKEAMPLGEALEKGIALHQTQIDSLQQKISGREAKIEELEMKVGQKNPQENVLPKEA